MPLPTTTPGDQPRRFDVDRFVRDNLHKLETSLVITFHCDRRTAAEVALEAVEQFWSNPGNFDPARGTELAWVRGIAVNIMRHRRRARGRSREVPLDPERLPCRLAPDPAERHEALAASAEVRAEVRRLGPDGEWAITGRYFEGKTIKQLMQEKDRTRRKVDLLIRRSMIRLHHRLRRLRSSLRVMQEPRNFRPGPGNSMQA